MACRWPPPEQVPGSYHKLLVHNASIVDVNCTLGNRYRVEAHFSQPEHPIGFVGADLAPRGVDLHVESSEFAKRVATLIAPAALHLNRFERFHQVLLSHRRRRPSGARSTTPARRVVAPVWVLSTGPTGRPHLRRRDTTLHERS